MKKTMVYIAAAVLLGLAVIMLPKQFATYESAKPASFEQLSPSNQDRSSDGEYYLLPSLGLGKPLTKALQPALILLMGLIAASCTYVIFERRRSSH